MGCDPVGRAPAAPALVPSNLGYSGSPQVKTPSAGVLAPRRWGAHSKEQQRSAPPPQRSPTPSNEPLLSLASSCATLCIQTQLVPAAPTQSTVPCWRGGERWGWGQGASPKPSSTIPSYSQPRLSPPSSSPGLWKVQRSAPAALLSPVIPYLISPRVIFLTERLK